MLPAVRAAALELVQDMHVTVPRAKQKDIIALPTFVFADGPRVLRQVPVLAEETVVVLAQERRPVVCVTVRHARPKVTIAPEVLAYRGGQVALLAAHQVVHPGLHVTLYPTAIRE